MNLSSAQIPTDREINQSQVNVHQETVQTIICKALRFDRIFKSTGCTKLGFTPNQIKEMDEIMLGFITNWG